MKTEDGLLEITGVTPVPGKFDTETGLRLPSSLFKVAAKQVAEIVREVDGSERLSPVANGAAFALTVSSDDPARVEAHAAASPLHHWQKEG